MFNLIQQWRNSTGLDVWYKSGISFIQSAGIFLGIEPETEALVSDFKMLAV